MSTTRCDLCRHWNKDSENQEWEAERAGFGECLAVRERWRIMDESGPRDWKAKDEAGAEAYIQRRIEGLKAARAYVQDASEYHAELFTAPDFFCALYAPNET